MTVTTHECRVSRARGPRTGTVLLRLTREHLSTYSVVYVGRLGRPPVMGYSADTVSKRTKSYCISVRSLLSHCKSVRSSHATGPFDYNIQRWRSESRNHTWQEAAAASARQRSKLFSTSAELCSLHRHMFLTPLSTVPHMYPIPQHHPHSPLDQPRGIVAVAHTAFASTSRLREGGARIYAIATAGLMSNCWSERPLQCQTIN
jgi:hypothetical protein